MCDCFGLCRSGRPGITIEKNKSLLLRHIRQNTTTPYKLYIDHDALFVEARSNFGSQKI